MNKNFQIKISCADKPGIIAAITGFIHKIGGNILDLNHHTEEATGLFFFLATFTVDADTDLDITSIENNSEFISLSEKYNWTCKVFDPKHKPKMAILASKTDHCLYELLLKLKDGYLSAQLAGILSNHNDLAYIADQFNVDFKLLSAGNNTDSLNKAILEYCESNNIETLVLARYMQIIGSDIVERWHSNIINVHHGFLPAFKGKRPYHQAWKKGVKIIGATAHYATDELDDGPIIYQDVASVDENLSINEFIEMGQDIERKVLVKALKLHLENRIFVHEGRTITL